MKWNDDFCTREDGAVSLRPTQEMERGSRKPIPAPQRVSAAAERSAVYADVPGQPNFLTLQENLENCLRIIDSDVMHSYIPTLQRCEVVEFDPEAAGHLAESATQPDIQFFRITQLVYQKDEFSVHKLSTVFHALSNKPCTLVLMIQSDGQSNAFYLGVRPRDARNSAGTMRKKLEQSLLGLFPGSQTAEYRMDELNADLRRLGFYPDERGDEGRRTIGCVSSVSCIADYKQEKDDIGNKSFFQGLEKFIYSMQGRAFTAVLIANDLEHQELVNTRKEYEQIYTLLSPFVNMQYSYSLNSSAGKSDSDMHTAGAAGGVSVNASNSIARAGSRGTTRTDSVSDAIFRSLTHGISASRSAGRSTGETEGSSRPVSCGTGEQYSEDTGESSSTSTAHIRVFSETFGDSQAVTLNVRNKSLQSMLERLNTLLERLDECESVGMWDFAAYFLGESAAEAEIAASMYQSLISGNQSGLRTAAVNTWTDRKKVNEILKYLRNFYHPSFLCQLADGNGQRLTMVDPTVLISTNELAIQLGLPRRSVKGLPVIEHASFAQEVLRRGEQAEDAEKIRLGVVNHLGRDTAAEVCLDLQSLVMHTFITGSTGTGKSNTVYQILSQLPGRGIHFLVIEPVRGEYKNVFGGREDVFVYGTNPYLTPLLRIDPFSFPKTIHVYEHLDRLVEIFNVCWPMYAAMPAVLKDAMERAYQKAGWDLRTSKNRYDDRLFPNFMDVLEEIDAVMDSSQYSSDDKSGYKGALSIRLRSLTNGINSLVFKSQELSPGDLFDRNVIVDLSRVGSTETRSLIMGLLVMKLQEYRMASCTGMNVPLSHVTVLEEAHNLLKCTATEQHAESSNLPGKSVEMLTNAIAEMRTYGEGFIIVDQTPGSLDMAVVRSTNTKIIMRLPEYSDRELVGRAAGLNEEQITELSKLGKGVAAVYQNDWLEAVLCRVCHFQGQHPEQLPSFAAESQEQPGNLVRDQLIGRLFQGSIDHLIDRVDDRVLQADMPAAAKRRLFEYVRAPDDEKWAWAAAVAYELFHAKPAFDALDQYGGSPDQQKYFLLEHLAPSLTDVPESYSRAILTYVTWWHANTAGSAAARALYYALQDPAVQE